MSGENNLFAKGDEIVPLSDDQSEAYAQVLAFFRDSGIALDGTPTKKSGSPAGADQDRGRVYAILGKAGTGKTRLLAMLGAELRKSGATQITGEYEGRAAGKRRFAIIAPTNKAASVLRNRGVEATTIHRVIYTPVYDPDYEKIADWLRDGGKGERPTHERLGEFALDRALEFYRETQSIPGALATAGLRGAEFITGWSRRDDSIEIGLVDESSMLDNRQLDDLRQVFDTLVLFGDPAQLAPVGQSDGMAFDSIPAEAKTTLTEVHRQSGGNPIIDLAYALEDPALEFRDFEALIREAASRDDRVIIAERADSFLMAQSPMLVWRNATRIRLIWAFRRAYQIAETQLVRGEPLICDGAELPLKQRKKRIALEQAGLVKGAQVFYLGPGKKPGFARLHVAGAEEPNLSASAIIQLERGDDLEPIIPLAARMGAVFVHGAACTIHKAQGSQWQKVQVFAPDLFAAAASGRMENGIALWKRLAYVAITRSEDALHWVVRPALSKPESEAGVLPDIGLF